MINSEVENETKFLLCAARKEDFVTWRTETLLNNYKPYSSGDHLIVYYEDSMNAFYEGNHTFRITYRKVDGVDKHRVTFKRSEYSDDFSIRTCTEFHYPLTKDLNPLKRCIKKKDIPKEALDCMELQGNLYRECWIRVNRNRVNINGIKCELDICKTNKGVYFEELETEEVITKEWVSALEKDIGPLWQSNVNKYKRTVLVNQM